MKEHIASLSLTELQELLSQLGEQKWRAKQIFEGIYNGKSISEITTISKELKNKLLEKFEDTLVKINVEKVGKDGTRKFVFLLSDGAMIEGVLMEYKYGRTICISTQVGCRMGCKFCASGMNGLIRSLTAGEILSEVLVVNRLIGGTMTKREITNIVLMGSGEPLDNYDNVSKFLKLVSSEDGINISQRNISLSTCGLPNGIKKLIEDGFNINLTISLHAANDEKRKKIMKVAEAVKIKEILQECKAYFNKTGRRVIFEYALIKDFNDSFEDAKELSTVLRGFPLHVNLIPLNHSYENGLDGTNRKQAYAFCDMLVSLGMSATVRRTMGDDIGGACGQLRNSVASAT